MEQSKTENYHIDTLTALIGAEIEKATSISTEGLALAEAPPKTGLDYGVQLARYAGQAKKNPVEVAAQVAEMLESANHDWIDSIKTMGPYLNFRIDIASYGQAVIEQIFSMGTIYGRDEIGAGKIVAVDMSSPNIAKRMSYGHLRSTIIGDAISSLYDARGYTVLRDNHIGDWGTQFGKLIAAMMIWEMTEDDLEAADDPIGALQTLYVRFHDEAEKQQIAERKRLAKGLAPLVDEIKSGRTSIEEILELAGDDEAFKQRLASQEALHGREGVLLSNLIVAVGDVARRVMDRKGLEPAELNMNKITEDALDLVAVSELDTMGRDWFRRLEEGDKEARRIWKLCVDLSMKEFDSIYETLGISFDLVNGEAYYEPMLKGALEAVKASGAATLSKGALIVDMEDVKLGVSVIQKSDGASLYVTRDIACALDRQNNLKVDRAVYVVGADQKHHFAQLFEILRRMGEPIGERSVHVYFGMVSLPEGKMSTRKGKVILLKDVITEGLKRAGEVLKNKNADLYADESKRDEIIHAIAIGAMKWNDIAHDPRREIVFDWDEALKLEGYAAPYVQYMGVRMKSMLRKADATLESLAASGFAAVEGMFDTQEERDLIKLLSTYPLTIAEAQEHDAPAKLAMYLFEVAKQFSSFYANCPVLNDEAPEHLKDSRLRLVAASLAVFENGMSLLGITIPDEM